MTKQMGIVGNTESYSIIAGKEMYMPTDKVNIPIMVNLMFIFTFLFAGALCFSSWEGWGLASSIYFCFITLTTIGFGDLWPSYSFLHYADGFGPFMQMVVTVLYSIFGKFVYIGAA